MNNMDNKLEKFGNGGLGYFDKEKNTFIIVKEPRKNIFDLKQIIDYLNQKGFTTYEQHEIRPEQCTGGNGLAVFYKGISFYIYLNSKNIKKIHNNSFEYNWQAYQIIDKIVRLINSFVVITETKNKTIRAIDKTGKLVPKRLPKLRADYIYGGILFENKADAILHKNKLLSNGIHCSVTNMVAYWNKTVQID